MEISNAICAAMSIHMQACIHFLDATEQQYKIISPITEQSREYVRQYISDKDLSSAGAILRIIATKEIIYTWRF